MTARSGLSGARAADETDVPYGAGVPLLREWPGEFREVLHSGVF